MNGLYICCAGLIGCCGVLAHWVYSCEKRITRNEHALAVLCEKYMEEDEDNEE